MPKTPIIDGSGSLSLTYALAAFTASWRPSGLSRSNTKAVIGVSFAADRVAALASAAMVLVPTLAATGPGAGAAAVVGGTSASKIGVNESTVCGAPSSRISNSDGCRSRTGIPCLFADDDIHEHGGDTRSSLCHGALRRRLLGTTVRGRPSGCASASENRGVDRDCRIHDVSYQAGFIEVDGELGRGGSFGVDAADRLLRRFGWSASGDPVARTPRARASRRPYGRRAGMLLASDRRVLGLSGASRAAVCSSRSAPSMSPVSRSASPSALCDPNEFGAASTACFAQGSAASAFFSFKYS